MLLTLLQSGGAGPGVITGNLAATEAGQDGMVATGTVGDEPSAPIFGGFSNRPWRDAPFLPVRPRRPRRQRQEELVFLGHY